MKKATKTKTINQIDKEIAALQEQINSVEGTKTEVYTRIVGYYRSVANWNKGKREEYNHRRLFSEPEDMLKHDSRQPVIDKTEHTTEAENAAAYTYFYRQSCPNCPPVKKYTAALHIPGDSIDVDTSEGMEMAIQHQVLASPTVIFFNNQGEEVFRAHNTETMEKIFTGTTIQVS